ncbi:hypothetical protein FXO37_29858 [Capsicum annuum]|nr:hypothetical protein FXO37_29858 [Capsicum annuum]
MELDKGLSSDKGRTVLDSAVIPLLDHIPHSDTELSLKVLEIKEVFHNLNCLEIKLKVLFSPSSLLSVCHLLSSGSIAINNICFFMLVTMLCCKLNCELFEMDWDTPVLDCDSSFIPPLAELVIFAALQPVSGNYSVSKYIYELYINVMTFDSF